MTKKNNCPTVGRRSGNRPRNRPQGPQGITMTGYSTSAKVSQLRAANGKVVARVEGDVLYKTISASRHLLREPAAIAFDVTILDAAGAAGAQTVKVFDRETGDLYTARLDDFYTRGIRFDRGHGAQIALPLAAWDIRRAHQLALLEV